MNEAGNIFYDEFMSKLEVLEIGLLNIQNGSHDAEDINELFRAMHTIKSTADLLGMFDVVYITHKAEDILDDVRSDKILLTKELVNIFLELHKFIKIMVDNNLNGISDEGLVSKLTIHFEKLLFDLINKPEDKKTVLIVDDSLVVRERAKNIIMDIGYQAVTSTNGVDGLEKFYFNKNIDLIICDVSVEAVGGMNMMIEIKEDRNYSTVPMVMFVSSLDNTSDLKSKAIQLGAKAWVMKPFQDNQLSQVVKRILK